MWNYICICRVAVCRVLVWPAILYTDSFAWQSYTPNSSVMIKSSIISWCFPIKFNFLKENTNFVKHLGPKQQELQNNFLSKNTDPEVSDPQFSWNTFLGRVCIPYNYEVSISYRSKVMFRVTVFILPNSHINRPNFHSRSINGIKFLYIIHIIIRYKTRYKVLLDDISCTSQWWKLW